MLGLAYRVVLWYLTTYAHLGLVVVPAGPVDGAEVQLRKLFAARVGEQALDLVAGLDRANTRGRASQDEVALLQKWLNKQAWWQAERWDAPRES